LSFKVRFAAVLPRAIITIHVQIFKVRRASRFGCCVGPVEVTALTESQRARCVSRGVTTPESTEGRVMRVVVQMELSLRVASKWE
jgi:hypothetical protein